MTSQDGREDEFTHQLAIKLSRALNIVNPNDLLARRVQDIAKSNSVDQFMQSRWIHPHHGRMLNVFPLSREILRQIS
jgi:hypothetical protein